MKKVKILENMAQEINSWNGLFEDIACVYTDLQELIEVSGKTGEEIARATFFGDIRNWCDDYFYINSYGNFASCTEIEHENSILAQKDEIIEEFLNIFENSLEDYQIEWLEELGIEVPEGSENE